MASLKAEKPVEKSPYSAGQVKKETAAKPSSGTPKAPASKPGPKKTPSQTRKKVLYMYIYHICVNINKLYFKFTSCNHVSQFGK